MNLTDRDRILLDLYYFLKSKNKLKGEWIAEFKMTPAYAKHYWSNNSDQVFVGDTHELCVITVKKHHKINLAVSNKVMEVIKPFIALYLDDDDEVTDEKTWLQPYWSIAKALQRLQEKEVALMRYIKLKVLLAT